MKKICDALIKNQYLGNCQDTVFTTLLREAFINSEIEFLKEYEYAHGLLLYPAWTSTTDIFQFLQSGIIEKIQNKKCFFIFDASTEGFSPVYQFPFFDILYYNCDKYNIDPSMIIFVSANLQDEKNIHDYCLTKNKKPVNVFSFLSFEKVVTRKKFLDTEKENLKQEFTDKYFSSLSRVNRQYRTMATFMLCHSTILKQALVSHDKIDIINTNLENWKLFHNLTNYDNSTISTWINSLPLTIDKTDFNKNWALDNDYGTIHHQTLFQVVNETLVDDCNETTLFYSEKTFRPIAYFQPFIIYGQKNANTKLKEFGYKLYDDWFDLSFDSESDSILRYKKLLTMLTDTCKYLDNLSRDQKIEWRFKNQELLIHNNSIMQASLHSKNKLLNFLLQFKNAHNSKTG